MTPNTNETKIQNNTIDFLKNMGYTYLSPEEMIEHRSSTRQVVLKDVLLKQDLDILKEMYRSGELSQEATTQKIRVVQKEGMQNVKREVDFYKLDARKYYSKIYLEGIVCKTKPTF